MKILVADDHALIAEGIASHFTGKDANYIIRTATNRAEVLRHLQNEHVDIILQDIQFGDSDGRDLIKEIVREYPKVKILALSSYADVVTVQTVLSAGAHSYVSKTSPLPELLHGVERTLENERFLSKDIQSKVTSSFLMGKSDSNEIRLTRREREVLDAIQNECSTKEIANLLNISEKTVEGYRSNLLLKFQVKNVAGLVKQALLKGFIS